MNGNKLKKVIRAGAAFLLAGVLSGCSVKFGTKKEPKLDKVVAHATAGEDKDSMDITYEMFRKEYKYLLLNNGIEDDTDEKYADYCTTQRQTIINYLMNEQIILRKAREMGVYDLTEEEMRDVDKSYLDNIELQVEYYGALAESEMVSEDGESVKLSDEEKERLGNERFDELLEKCGMTRDDLLWWAQSGKITDKLQAKLGENVPYSKAEEEFKKVQDYAKELYNSKNSMYATGGYDDIWLPEDTRLIKHILISFDSDTASEISELRRDGSDDEADKVRAEAAEALEEKRLEIETKLDEGEDFDELIKEYSGDKTGSASYPDGYTVFPNGGVYMPEFEKAAFVPEKIGDRTTCVTDYGVHIILYAGDAKVSEESKKQYTDYLHEQLIGQEFADRMTEWAEQYAFEIDYDALRLEAPEEKSEQ